MGQFGKNFFGKIKILGLVLVLGAAFFSALVGIAGAAVTTAGNLQATATVVGRTCTMSTATNSITFNGVVPGGSTPTQANPFPINIQNTGTVNGELFLSGTVWSGNSQVNVNATQWYVQQGIHANTWTSLQATSSPADTGMNITPTSTQNLWFRLSFPASVTAGTYSQTIVLSTSC